MTLTAGDETPFDAACRAIETLCGADVGRNIGPLVAASRGSLARAARALDTASGVLVLTGCFIPEADPPAAETDGPIGAALLATGLARLGHLVAVVTDERCLAACRAAVTLAPPSPRDVAVGLAGAGFGGDVGEIVWTVPPEGGSWSHVVAIERLGPTRDGTIRSMRGAKRDAVSGGAHLLFTRTSAHRIAVGDGGNELGMGSLPHDLVAAAIEFGATIHCVVPADELVVAGCSNWGALGLLAALAVLGGRARVRDLSDLYAPPAHRRILEGLHAGSLAVDGVTGRATRSVDGIGEARHEAVLRALGEVVDQVVEP